MSKRLTKEDRANFVEGVMRDTPDRTAELTKAIELIMQAEVKNSTPKEIYDIWTNPDLKGYIQWDATPVDPDVWRERVDYPCCGPRIDFNNNAEFVAAREALAAYKVERMALHDQLLGMISGFKTVKAALEGLPEFAKYLPADTKPAYAVAVVAANVVSTLNKAGWPTEKK